MNSPSHSKSPFPTTFSVNRHWEHRKLHATLWLGAWCSQPLCIARFTWRPSRRHRKSSIRIPPSQSSITHRRTFAVTLVCLLAAKQARAGQGQGTGARRTQRSDNAYNHNAMEQKLGSAFFADTCSLQGETMRLITKYTSASGKFPLSVIGTRASTVTRKFDKAATIRDKISQTTQSRRRSNRSFFFSCSFFCVVSFRSF